MSLFKTSNLSNEPSDKRNIAYTNAPLIVWENSKLTVDQANEKYVQYFIEEDEKSNQIKTLIIDAKNTIRNLYPDEV